MGEKCLVSRVSARRKRNESNPQLSFLGRVMSYENGLARNPKPTVLSSPNRGLLMFYWPERVGGQEGMALALCWVGSLFEGEGR